MAAITNIIPPIIHLAIKYFLPNLIALSKLASYPFLIFVILTPFNLVCPPMRWQKMTPQGLQYLNYFTKAGWIVLMPYGVVLLFSTFTLKMP